MSVLPRIEEEFVAIGQAKLDMRPVAFLGEESDLATQAAQCAGEQGRFWDYHDALYANQVPEHNSGAFSRQRLGRMAEALALDVTAFESCLDSGRYAAMVESETNAARQAGVNKTPTIFVNGREVAGTVNDLASAIREALAAGS